jgi:membrane protease YdiL (CAAX protease family)
LLSRESQSRGQFEDRTAGAGNVTEGPAGRGLLSPGAFIVATALAFILPPGPFNLPLTFILLRIFPPAAAAGIAMMAQEAALIAALAIIVTGWEGMPLSSIGMVPPRIADFLLAIGAAALAIVMVAVLQLHLLLIPKPASLAHSQRNIAAFIALPLWIRLSQALGNALAEEIGFRGYVLQRVIDATGIPGLAVAASSIASSLLHVPQWGMRYAMMAFPAELIFALLYAYRTNVWTCVAAHFMVDAFDEALWPVLPRWGMDAFWRIIASF